MTKAELEDRVAQLESWNEILCANLEAAEQYLAGQALGEYIKELLLKYIREVTE